MGYSCFYLMSGDGFREYDLLFVLFDNFTLVLRNLVEICEVVFLSFSHLLHFQILSTYRDSNHNNDTKYYAKNDKNDWQRAALYCHNCHTICLLPK
jgi:hypothetical protein